VSDMTEPQAPEAFPTNTAEDSSQSHSRENEETSAARPTKATRSGQPTIRKKSGPRTGQGKNRSRLNAFKHGIFSKAIVLASESPVEYLSVLAALRGDLRPGGTLEELLVENLAALFWRKRRFFQAETAEISEKILFTQIDSIAKLRAEAEDLSQAASTSGGLLKHLDNPFVVRESIRLFAVLGRQVSTIGITEDSPVLVKLYGRPQDERDKPIRRRIYEDCGKRAWEAEQRGDRSEYAELVQTVIKLIDRDIDGLKDQEKILDAEMLKKGEFKRSAAFIPGPEVSDRLMRYETHLSREIERILNRLERVQRMRGGQRLPPQIDVNVG
jgi:hypothetical protein